jgi:splicing suppressor protein 51
MDFDKNSRATIEDFWYTGLKNNESVFNGTVSSCPPFRWVLDQSEAKRLIPRWRSDKKRLKCLTLGLTQRWDDYHASTPRPGTSRFWSSTENAINTMKTQMFAESVLGRGPAGTNGKLVLQKMVVAEEAHEPQWGNRSLVFSFFLVFVKLCDKFFL